MSLTSFLRNPDVRKKFHEEFPVFPKPELSPKTLPLAPLLTKNPMLIGTAFDYLLRFYIERLNRKKVVHNGLGLCENNSAFDAHRKKWVAENSFILIKKQMDNLCYKAFLRKNHLKISSGKARSINKEYQRCCNIYKKVLPLLFEAQHNYRNYLESKSEAVSNELIQSTLHLAYIDGIYRSSSKRNHFLDGINAEQWIIRDNDIKELKNLIKMINPKYFKAKTVCLLNPHFEEASMMIGGADADLVIDDILIDIKTTKKLSIEREIFNQIMGYYILSEIGTIEGLNHKHEIKRLGIYFSRFGLLHTIDLKDVINKKTFPKFSSWFEKRALAR